MKEEKLMNILVKHLKAKKYDNILKTNDFIIAEGEIPICLIAHCDTVFLSPPKNFFYDQKQQVLWSAEGAGFDDRAGIYAILELLEQGYKPSVIFTTGEELGGIGASALINMFPKYPYKQPLKFIIELDRRGWRDCVFYDCNNKKFVKKIQEYGFKKAQGSFSDISFIMESWDIAGVNLSIGYMDEHTTSERLYIKDLKQTIEKVSNILKDADILPIFKYIPNKELLNFKHSTFQFKEEYPENICAWCGKIINKNNQNWIITDEEYFLPLCDECYNFYKA